MAIGLFRARNRLAAAANGPVSRTPTEDENLGALLVLNLEQGDVVGDIGDLPSPGVGHQLMVLGVIGDVAGDRFLLHTSDPVLETRRARYRPGAGESLEVALVGKELLWPMPFGLRPAANGTEISGRLSTSGSIQGSEELATWLSDNRITGVMYLRAIRAASMVKRERLGGRRNGDNWAGAPRHDGRTWQ